MWILVLAGLAAGFIDSIAGGGGLITLPTLSLFLDSNAHAIGTNKVVGFTGALIALIVYSKKFNGSWKIGLFFSFCISIGSALGSLTTPYIPNQLLRWLLILLCPVILGIVFQKNRWISLAKHSSHNTPPNVLAIILSGFICGFYDGAIGPGGGTFMLIALLIAAKLPLFESLTLSKLANTFSAGTALLSFNHQGFVHWDIGLLLALGMGVGSFVGSKLASRKAEKIVRPMLGFAVLLLMIKLVQDALKELS